MKNISQGQNSGRITGATGTRDKQTGNEGTLVTGAISELGLPGRTGSPAKFKQSKIIALIIMLIITAIDKQSHASYTFDQSPCKNVYYTVVQSVTSSNQYVGLMELKLINGVLESVWHGMSWWPPPLMQVNAKQMYWNGSIWAEHRGYNGWVGSLPQGFIQVGSHTAASYGQCDTCTPQKNNLISQCGGTEKVDWETWEQTTCTGTCLPQCENELVALTVQCGGSQYIENFDSNTCEGNCFCDETPNNPNTHTYIQVRDFCGGASKVKVYDKNQCVGECKGCDQEYQTKEAECASQGLKINRTPVNESLCEYECEKDCSSEYQALEQQCGIVGISSFDNETCTGNCKQDCTDEFRAKETECGIAGIGKWSDDTCTGTCRDCEYYAKQCEKRCAGTFATSECSDGRANGRIVAIDIGPCTCADPREVVATKTGTTDSEIPEPGSQGGTVETLPNGDKIETLPDGTKIKYSADGKSVTVEVGEGKTIEKRIGENGEVKYSAIDESGRKYEIVDVPQEDGTILRKRTTYANANINNPELEPNWIETDTETEIVRAPDKDLDGNEIPGTGTTPTTPGEPTEKRIDGIVATSGSTGVSIPDFSKNYEGITVPVKPERREMELAQALRQDEFRAVGQSMAAKMPTAMFENIVHMFGTESNEAPVINIRFPSVNIMGKNMEVIPLVLDLSPLDIVAKAVRWLLGILMVVGAIHLFRRIVM